MAEEREPSVADVQAAFQASVAGSAPATVVPKKDAVDQLLDKLSDTVFDLKIETHPFKIKNKQGDLISYEIREADDDARSTYIDFQSKMANYEDGKVTGIRDIRGLHRKLVCACVFNTATGQPVVEGEVMKWPGRLVADLHGIAARISGLDAKAEERAKNS